MHLKVPTCLSKWRIFQKLIKEFKGFGRKNIKYAGDKRCWKGICCEIMYCNYEYCFKFQKDDRAPIKQKCSEFLSNVLCDACGLVSGSISVHLKQMPDHSKELKRGCVGAKLSKWELINMITK